MDVRWPKSLSIQNKIVTAPAYMCDASLADIAAGMKRLSQRP